VGTPDPGGVEQVADEVIALVRDHQDLGGKRSDTAGLVMYGAYIRAFRRFTRIRQLAGDGAGEEAVILARSLLSIVARSAWVDIPDDVEERRRRFGRYKKRQLQDEVNEAEGLATVGVGIDIDIDDLRADLEQLADVPMLPNDFDLLKSLGLTIYYERLYRLSSGYIHFSLRQAIDELRAAGEEVALERPEPELADEALRLAIVTFGLFLKLSQKTVEHNLGDRALEIIQRSAAFAAEG
jgi:hypothetical protein